MMRFADKSVIVTGAAQGIGLACAEAFIVEGARVALSDVDKVKGRAAADRLGPNATFYACDVADKAAVAATVQAVVEPWR